MQSTSVVILSANVVSGNGLKQLVIQAGIRAEAVALFADAAGLCASLDERSAHIALVADVLPDVPNFRKFIAHLQQAYPGVRLIVFSQRLNTDYIRDLFALGIHGFIDDKSRMEQVIPLALAAVREGRAYVSPEAALLPYHEPMVTVTSRDMEVLRWLASGKDVTDIAGLLAVARHVVYKSRSRLRAYLGVTTNEQIIPAAMARGLLDDLQPHE